MRKLLYWIKKVHSISGFFWFIESVIRRIRVDYSNHIVQKDRPINNKIVKINIANKNFWSDKVAVWSSYITVNKKEDKP